MGVRNIQINDEKGKPERTSKRTNRAKKDPKLYASQGVSAEWDGKPREIRIPVPGNPDIVWRRSGDVMAWFAPFGMDDPSRWRYFLRHIGCREIRTPDGNRWVDSHHFAVALKCLTRSPCQSEPYNMPETVRRKSTKDPSQPRDVFRTDGNSPLAQTRIDMVADLIFSTLACNTPISDNDLRLLESTVARIIKTIRRSSKEEDKVREKEAALISNYNALRKAMVDDGQVDSES